MKILFFAKNFYSNSKIRGGMEKYLYNLILKLREKHEIILLVPNRYNISIDDVKVYNFYEIRLPLFSFITVFISLLISVPRILLMEKPQFVSAFIPSFGSTLLFFIANLFGIKKVINLRGLWRKTEYPLRILSGPTFLLTDAIITNSKEFIPEYEKSLFIPKNIFRSIPKYYIPNGVDTNFWKTKNKTDKQSDLVFIGNLHSNKRLYQKGFNVLYSSLNYIKKKYDYNIEIIMIGKRNKSKIEKIIGRTNKMFFEWKGLILNRVDLKNLIQKAKIFVLTSEIEGMPNALMEAMSMGMPCVSTNAGAVPELISDGYNGFIAPKGDYNVLGEKIWELLNNEDLQDKFGINARKRMLSKFSWKRNIELVEKCYLSIIKT